MLSVSLASYVRSLNISKRFTVFVKEIIVTLLVGTRLSRDNNIAPRLVKIHFLCGQTGIMSPGCRPERCYNGGRAQTISTGKTQRNTGH